MASLSDALGLVLAAAMAPVPAAAPSVTDWQPYIAEASQRCGTPEPWIRAVMRLESGGRTMRGGRPIVSKAGAMGLMQLMPATWRAMRDGLRLGDDPFDPRDNILAGACYLRLMYAQFGYPGLFAAYNAGPGRYRDWLAGGASLPAETIDYVARIAAPGAAAVSIAPTRAGVLVAPRATGIAPRGDGLFAIAPRW